MLRLRNREEAAAEGVGSELREGGGGKIVQVMESREMGATGGLKQKSHVT